MIWPGCKMKLFHLKFFLILEDVSKIAILLNLFISIFNNDFPISFDFIARQVPRFKLWGEYIF